MVNKYDPIPLGEIAYITKLAGYEYTKYFDYQVGGEIIALRSLNVKDGSIDLSEIHTIPKSVSDALPRSKLIREDIVLGYVGSKLGNLAKIEEDNRFHLAPNVAVIRPNEGVSSDYLLQYMQSEHFQSRLWAFASSTGQPALSMTNIRKLPVLIFPLIEQQKIAKTLSTWDKAISTTERLIENSTQQKKALMQQLLTGKKRLLDESGKRFEGEWENQTIESLTSRVGDGIHSTPKYTDKSSVRFVNGNNLNNGSIVFSDSTKFVNEDDAKNHHRNLSSRTILMSINGTIGNLAIYKYENIVLGKSACYINVKEEVDVLFIFYKLSSSEVQSHFISRLTGSTIKNLSLTTIKSTQVALPSLTEQQKIATVLTNADKEIELLEQQLADLQQEKKALMQVLLTGKKRVMVE